MSEQSTRLIAVTTGVGELEGRSAEEVIAYTARVSNPSNQNNFDTASKLLGYCIKNKHWSVFETSAMTVEIITSRAIAQQILRHRSFTFQEFSQRYATALDNCTYAARRQDDKNRQSSIDDMSEEDKQWFINAQDSVWEYTNAFYKRALDKGIAKEQARMVLPLSTQTKIFMTGNCRSWIHYIELRSTLATQKEHRDVANGCKLIFNEQFPSIADAMGWLPVTV